MLNYARYAKPIQFSSWDWYSPLVVGAKSAFLVVSLIALVTDGLDWPAEAEEGEVEAQEGGDHMSDEGTAPLGVEVQTEPERR